MRAKARLEPGLQKGGTANRKEGAPGWSAPEGGRMNWLLTPMRNRPPKMLES